MKLPLVLSTLALGSILALATAANAAPPPPPPPHISFGLTLGSGGPPPSDDDCLSTREILAGLRDEGYRRFRNFDDSDDDSFTVDVQRGTRWYELEVDSCSGDILDRTRIRP